MKRILLDTDIGSDVDDALALGLILACPESLELAAVTTVAGDTALRARIAAGLLGLAGRGDVEVCRGAAGPLLRSSQRFASFGHEEKCLPGGPNGSISDEPAPERIVRAAREIRDLELVLIGPMTNLALALALDPELPARVAGLTIMGGHIREARIGDHRCAPGIDYNLCSDPEASVAVLGAGFATTLVTADVTLRTWLRREDLARMDAAGPVARVLADQVRIWAPVQREIFTGLGGTLARENVAFLHDPLTVLVLIDPAPLGFEALSVGPTIERGVLRTHEVDASAGIGHSMRVATSVDADAARTAIIDRLVQI